MVIKCAITATPTYYFHPVALTTGLIWSVGNIFTSTIIKCIGMALGMSIWCATQLIIGWSTGKWGLLGTPKDDTVQIEWLNYLGVCLVFVSLVLYFMVRPNNLDTAEVPEYYKNDLNASQHGVAVNYQNGSGDGPLHEPLHNGLHGMFLCFFVVDLSSDFNGILTPKF